MTADYIIGMCLSIFTSLSSLLTITSRWRRQEFMARLYNVLSWINRFFQLQNTVYSSLFSFSFSIIRCIWVPADIFYTLNFHHISNTLLTRITLGNSNIAWSLDSYFNLWALSRSVLLILHLSILEVEGAWTSDSIESSHQLAHPCTALTPTTHVFYATVNIYFLFFVFFSFAFCFRVYVDIRDSVIVIFVLRMILLLQLLRLLLQKK